MHVKTDFFCSASPVLPNKAGRQITTAGWSGSAEHLPLHSDRVSRGAIDYGQGVLKSQAPFTVSKAPVYSNTAYLFSDLVGMVVLADSPVLLMGGEVVLSAPKPIWRSCLEFLAVTLLFSHFALP
jgi:hypothetical protein